MAQADGWPKGDVNADLDVAPGANEQPSQHGAAADKYYQLLSLHGDTVRNLVCRHNPAYRNRLSHPNTFVAIPGSKASGDHGAPVLCQLRRLEAVSANHPSVESSGETSAKVYCAYLPYQLAELAAEFAGRGPHLL